jgi:hypothetical protein
MRIFYRAIIVLLAATCGMTVIANIASVDYPTDYRSWQHTKSMIIQPGHALENPFGGIHHIYANSKAMNGLTDGRYEAGAVFVFDLLDYIESDNVIVEGGRKRIDVMQYDSKRFSETGGWGYGSFVGDSKTERFDQDVVAACFACHTSTESTNYVFSNYRN